MTQHTVWVETDCPMIHSVRPVLHTLSLATALTWIAVEAARHNGTVFLTSDQL